MMSEIVCVFRYGIMAAAVAVSLLSASCGGDDDDDAAAVSGEFVSVIPNSDPAVTRPGSLPHELVAVVADPPKAGGDSRTVRVYVCDGDTSNAGDAEWFTGTVAGNQFELMSVDGDASVQVILAADAATGTVALPDGRTLEFTAEPAADGGGLYDIFNLPNGFRRGTSAGGNQLEGEVISQTVDDGLTTRRVAFTITTPDDGTFQAGPVEEVTIGPPAARSLVAIIVPLPPTGFLHITGRTDTIKQGMEPLDFVTRCICI